MKKVYALEELLIKAENISLKYGNNLVLRDINFEIRNVTRPDSIQGQIVALIGRSGLGKTQLFRILSGLNKPTTGQVWVYPDQHKVTPGEVGIVPQNYFLFNHRTIFENLRQGVLHSSLKRSEAERKELILKHAEDFGLAEHLQKYPTQLSGGQRQRVSIIQQVLTDNKFILLDEPFSGLDPIMVDKVIELLNKISSLNELNTLIIVSHDLENSMAISDTVWIMAKENNKEGATITRQLDLKDMGLAWNPDIRKSQVFQQLVDDVKSYL